MANVLVTLVSEQAIPNVQYIKEFQPSAGYLFISTVKMEAAKKTDNIIAACGLDSSLVHIITVNEEDFRGIQSKIAEAWDMPIFKEADNIVVNCTLGTKVMSIALFDYFKDNPKAKIYYTPINTNKYKGIYSEEEGYFAKQVTIEEYFKGYGIGIKKKSTPFSNLSVAEQIFKCFIRFRDEDFAVLEQLRERRKVDKNGKTIRVVGRDKGVDTITDIPNLPTFLDKIGFKPKTPNTLTKHEVVYLTGGWFEEWAYFKIKEELSLSDNQIAIGLESILEAGNDLDVVFIWKNDLHIIECKTTLSKDLQQNTLYKSGALIDKFGRNAKSYLFTLSDLRKEGVLQESIDLRARQQNIIVREKSDLVHGFEGFISQLKR